MATESLLVKTKDNNVIVLSITYNTTAEKLRIINLCERYCQSVNYADFNSRRIPSAGVDFDSANTEFLREEIAGYHYVKQPESFVNEMKENDFPPRVNKSNTLHFDFRLADDFFPEMIKNVGYKIKPEDEIFKVQYSLSKGKYEVVDFKIKRAQVNHSRKELIIVRNHFKFEPKDYAKLQKMIADYKVAKLTNPKLGPIEYARGITNQKDLSLFNIYAHEQEYLSHLDSTIAHELKHIKNSVFLDGLGLKDDYKQMSPENLYRLCVENERSSYLQQLAFCINKYLKQGDLNDFSMFDGESAGCANYLNSLRTKEERLSYATNWPVLMARIFEQFDNKHQKYYDENQFAGNMLSMAESQPVSAPKDVDAKTFNKVRSMYYHYMIYNPLTGKEESVNLAKYIDSNLEVKINPLIRLQIIRPAERKLEERRARFNSLKNSDEINPNLIAPAKALMRSGLHSSSFINEVDDLNISRLLDENDKPQADVVNSPAPAVANDRSFWSDDLQKYWSKVEGYREIAKNNNEYTFTVNQAKISYSDKRHVKVSSNADFALYVKLLKEPSSKNNTIEFAPTLSREQALMLYIACVNYGRKMSGRVPTDLSGISRLQGIPPEELNKFNHRSGNSGNQQTNVVEFPSPQKGKIRELKAASINELRAHVL